MKQRDLMIILIPALIITVLWVIFNIYHNYASSTIKDPLSYQIIPIEGTFDIETIEKIMARIRVEPAFQIEISASESSTPTPEIEPDEAGTESAEITPTDSNEEQ